MKIHLVIERKFSEFSDINDEEEKNQKKEKLWVLIMTTINEAKHGKIWGIKNNEKKSCKTIDRVESILI